MSGRIHRMASGQRIARGAAAALAIGLACAASVRAQSMTNVHVSSGGVQGSSGVLSSAPTVSDDDRYVAFASTAANLVPGDVNGFSDVFVYDTATATIVLISRDTAGGGANADCVRPAISGTGRYVVYCGGASDLVAGDTNGMVDVFLHDRDTDVDAVFDEAGATSTIRVSVSSSGAQANGHSRSYEWALSNDGNVIVFESEATNLVAGDTNGVQDCFLRLVSAAYTERMSVSSAGAQSAGSSGYPAVSGDGTVVAFLSGGADLVAGDTNGVPDIFLRSATGTARVSVASSGAQGNGASLWPALSNDGGVVVFQSDASNLVAGDGNGATDIFVREVAAGATTRASVSSAGVEGNTASFQCGISGDGNVVAFVSTATNLVGDDTNGFFDVYARDRAAGLTARVSRAADGTQGNGISGYYASVSEDGSHVAFVSEATTLVATDTNGAWDAFLRGEPFLGPGGGPGPGPVGADDNPVTFSVSGPVDPHTEGVRYARGTPPTPQVPLQPANPIGHCIRGGPVAQASGLPTPWPGDVFDYDAAGVPSEAVMFQSPPFLPPPPGPPAPPDGTNNQILEAMGMGLISGGPVPVPMWDDAPPLAMGRDNVDAFSFGEDYFPPMIVTGYAPGGFPLPPMDGVASSWAARVSLYNEPIVIGDMPGISFRFSEDPWAIGAAATALVAESGGADAGAFCAGWTSPGEAAGDVFGTPVLMRAAGATVGGGLNVLVHDQPTIALAPVAPPLMPAEDDLDALECIGDNTSPWFGGAALRPGDLHDRVIHAGAPGPPPPGLSVHDPVNDAPVFFSVTRNSPGGAFTAVRTSFVVDGGAASDIFVAVKDPADPAGVGMNLLFIDEAEIGLYAADASAGGSGPMDYCDDLDGLILWVCPEYRYLVSLAIDEMLGIAPPFTPGGFAPWGPYGFGDALIGGGMTISITKYLAGTGRPIPPGCIRVGFSVTTDAIGLEYTAVDWEAGPVAPPGGVAAAAGDIFYSVVDGTAVGTNSLWYEETDLGQDAGGWVNGASTDLADLTDNLNALDSWREAPDSTMEGTSVPGLGDHGAGPGCPAHGGVSAARQLTLEPATPNPFNPRTTIGYTLAHDGRVRITVHDVRGRMVAELRDEAQSPGRHEATWEGRDDAGAEVGSGIYFLRVESGSELATQKILLLE